MSAAAWLADLIAALLAGGAAARAVLTAGRREGKIDLLLQQQGQINSQLLAWVQQHDRQHSAGLLDGVQAGRWDGLNGRGG